jgi:glycosyltransferase involved in cell wall biosynthesis
VLFVGHLDFYKGLDVLLDAWDMLPADRFELTVVGISNPSWDSYFRERIEAAEGVQYLGALPHGTMPAIYARHDVLAFPSLVGGVGLSTFEAMAAGVVPLVPSDEGLLRAGVDCVVVPRHEGNAWAAALTQLDADRLLLSSMADAGIVAAAATPTQYTEAVVNAYRTIAAREGLEPLMETLSHS